MKKILAISLIFSVMLGIMAMPAAAALITPKSAIQAKCDVVPPNTPDGFE